MSARRLVLAALAATLLPGCALLSGAFRPPELDFEKVRFKALSFKALQADLVFSITNPNAIGAQMDGYAMRFVVDGVTLLDGRVDRALDLRGGARSTLILPVKIKWKDLAARLARGGGVPDSLPFEAGGSLRFNTPVGPLDLPFETDGKIPVVKPPSVSPAGIRVVSASLTGARIAVDLNVSSPTGRALSVLGFSPVVTLNGKKVATAQLSKAVKVKGRKKTKRTLTLDLSLARVGGAVARLLAGGGPLQVGLAGETTVDTGFGKIPYSFDVSKRLALGR